jgi:hypothetical protein
MQLFKMAGRRHGAGTAAAVCESDSRLRYGGPWFSAASALPLEGRLIRSGRLATLVAAGIRRPGRIVALIVLLLRTRSEELFLSASPAGQALDAYFNKRSLGVFPENQFCRGVLLLPQDHSEYLRGRSRQSLRTNLRRATAAGITCENVSDPSRVLDEFTEVCRSARDDAGSGWLAGLARPHITLMAARGKCGRPLALAGVVIDDSVCLIVFAVAISHEARWALHDHLVRTLIARRARYLLAEGRGPFGALGFTANVQHYQHLLGYELRHLIPVPPDAMTWRRPLLALVAVAAVSAATLLTPAAAAGATGFM